VANLFVRGAGSETTHHTTIHSVGCDLDLLEPAGRMNAEGNICSFSGTIVFLFDILGTYRRVKQKRKHKEKARIRKDPAVAHGAPPTLV